MTYLHYLSVAAFWTGLSLGGVILGAVALAMFLAIINFVDSDSDDRKIMGIIWAIGVPVLFFGIPGYVLLVQSLTGS